MTFSNNICSWSLNLQKLCSRCMQGHPRTTMFSRTLFQVIGVLLTLCVIFLGCVVKCLYVRQFLGNLSPADMLGIFCPLPKVIADLISLLKATVIISKTISRKFQVANRRGLKAFRTDTLPKRSLTKLCSCKVVEACK